MTIELTYTATNKARTLSATLGAMSETDARNWLIRALAIAKHRPDLAAQAADAAVYELPADHLTSMGGRLAAIVRAGDVHSSQLVAVTIKALSSLLRAKAHKDAEEAAEARLELEAEAADKLRAPAKGIENLSRIVVTAATHEKMAEQIVNPPAPTPALVALMSTPSPCAAKGETTTTDSTTRGTGDNRGARSLRVAMAERKLSQQQVALLTGVTNQAISKISRGVAMPSLTTACALEDQLKIKMRWWVEQ